MWIREENVGINHFEISTPFSSRDERRNLTNFYKDYSFTFFPCALERLSSQMCAKGVCVTSHNTDLAQKSYDEGKEKQLAIRIWDKEGALVFEQFQRFCCLAQTPSDDSKKEACFPIDK